MKKLVESQFFVGNREGECGGIGKWIVGMADKVVDRSLKVVGKLDKGTDIWLSQTIFVLPYGLLTYMKVFSQFLLADFLFLT